MKLPSPGTPVWVSLSVILLALFMAGIGSTGAFAQHPVPVEPPAPWRDPVFVNRFLGTYGVRSDIEPTITAEEQSILRDLIPMIEADPAAAAQSLRNRLRADSSAALDFTMGNLLFQLDQPEAAIRHYRDALRKFPDFMRAHKNLGLSLVRLEDFAEAIPSLARALELGGTDGNAYGVIGYAHLQNGRVFSAEAAYRQALLFHPDNPNWKLGLVQSLQQQERHRETLVLLDELLADYPERVDHWLLQANAYLALDEPLSAAGNLEMARRLGRRTAQVLLSLGEILVNANLPALAVERLAEALEVDFDASLDRVLRAAEAMALRGETVPAGDLLTQTRERRPDPLSEETNLRILRIEARIALDQGRDGEARGLLETLLEKNPTDGEAHLLLAESLSREGSWERAVLLLERAARLPDYAARAHRLHGELLAGQRRYAEAAEQLRLALNLRPDESLARFLTQIERLAELD